MHTVLMPVLGQSVEEAAIVRWLKEEGDAVSMGEPICTVQTDKAELEVESTAEGVLRKQLVPPDDFVEVKTPIAFVGTADEPLPEVPRRASPDHASESASPAAPGASAPSPPPAGTVEAPANGGRQAVSPRARATAAALHVDPSQIAGSGAGGRVMEQDVLRFSQGVKASPAARAAAKQRGAGLRGLQGSGPGGRIMKADLDAAPPLHDVETVPLTPMRRVIAERMTASKFTAPHYYVTVEVDMKASVAFRTQLAEFRPSYNDLVLRACVRAAARFPQVNARWAGEHIELVRDINLGIAVALEEGLVVPVLKRAQHLTLEEIASQSRALIEKVKANKLALDDYQGNTLTVSNLGAFGVEQFTAIINQPDSAILAIGAIKDKPVVINDGIAIRPMMTVTMSSDHRVIDGAVAAQFLAALKETLEAADF